MPRYNRHQLSGMSITELTILVKQIMTQNSSGNEVYIPGPKGDKGDKGTTGSAGENVTEAQVESAVDAYMTANPVHNGEDGSDGSNATPEMIAEAVASYLTNNPPAPGIKGDKGNKGDTGSQGIQGEPGMMGPKGDTGAQGLQGLKGDTGSVGPQGVKGDTGLTGSKGDTGSAGNTGSMGPTGPQGLTGATGPQGVAGSNATVIQANGSAALPLLALGGSTNVVVTLDKSFPDTNYNVLMRAIAGAQVLSMLTLSVVSKTVNTVTVKAQSTGLASVAGVLLVDCYRSGT